jgi:hypothetical protein
MTLCTGKGPCGAPCHPCSYSRIGPPTPWGGGLAGRVRPTIPPRTHTSPEEASICKSGQVNSGPAVHVLKCAACFQLPRQTSEPEPHTGSGVRHYCSGWATGGVVGPCSSLPSFRCPLSSAHSHPLPPARLGARCTVRGAGSDLVSAKPCCSLPSPLHAQCAPPAPARPPPHPASRRRTGPRAHHQRFTKSCNSWYPGEAQTQLRRGVKGGSVCASASSSTAGSKEASGRVNGVLRATTSRRPPRIRIPRWLSS